MPKSKPFNGHRSWNAWNVSLWINNDETLYGRARELVKAHGRVSAARMLLAELEDDAEGKRPKTPDGAPYTYTTIREALAGM